MGRKEKRTNMLIIYKSIVTDIVVVVVVVDKTLSM